MTTALGVAPDGDGSGLTPLAHRKVISYQYESKGIIGGFDVTGTSGLEYDVAEGVAVTSKGDSDGYALAYYEGGTVETEAGDSSNPRYDVLWVASHDLQQGDEDNSVTLGVTQGSAASSPSVPDVDSDCTVVDTLYVPAGMTATTSCTSTGEVDYAIPYGAASGSFGGKASTTTNAVSTTSTTVFSKTITLPTDRYVEVKAVFRMMYTIDPDDDLAGDATGSKYAMAYVSCYLDGELASDDADCMPAFTAPVRNVQTWRLGIEAGTHTIAVKVKARTSGIYWAAVREVWLDDCGVMQ